MSSTMNERKLIVIGCGVDFEGDDAVGLQIVRQLGFSGEHPPEWEFHFARSIGPELLDLFERADVILVIDAVVGAAAPGTILLARLPTSSVLPRHIGPLSPSGWGVDALVSLAKTEGLTAPPLLLLGIEIQEVVPGEALSRPVEAAMHYTVTWFAEIAKRIERLESSSIAEPEIIEPPLVHSSAP